IYGTVYRMILNGCSHSRIPFTFPTRRSSDLAGTLLADDEAGGQDHADNLLPRLDLLLEKRLLAPGRGVRDDDVEPAGVGVRLPQDRKSTRLNSSHVAISYAVFCLKKKNRSQL